MRILVVEDEKDLRNIIKKRLVREHYSVDACGDGEEALDYMEMTSYDVVLLDIMLSGKDGFAVLKEVRQMGNDTPILLLTARDGIEDRVKGLNLGADDYLRSGYKNCDKSWKRDQFVVKRIYGVRMSDAESEYRNDEAAD